MLGGIFQNINVILEKITSKIKYAGGATSDEPVVIDNNEVTEIVDEIVARKRDIEKEPFNLGNFIFNLKIYLLILNTFF